MILNRRISAFVQLGKIFSHLGEGKAWDGYHLGVNETEFNALEDTIHQAKLHNGWFDAQNVRLAFTHLAKMLEENALNNWLKSYEIKEDVRPKTVAIIMAGNIPMVGFHDLLCVLLSGHKAIVKLASEDKILLPKVVDVLCQVQPEFGQKIEFTTNKIKDFDAIIATGSNNSARYFDAYFGKYPSIIRKNRTSVAVLNGSETQEELEKLADDVFMFYGLGCRNISKLFVPKNFNIDGLFKAFYKYKDVINNNKYGNNFDYNRAVYLMNKLPILENGFLLLKEDENLHSPLSVLFYETYKNEAELNQKLDRIKPELQCVVGKSYLPFGAAQQPTCSNYADGIDTMNFLNKL